MAKEPIKVSVEEIEHLERSLKTLLAKARGDKVLGDFVAMQQHSSHFSRA